MKYFLVLFLVLPHLAMAGSKSEYKESRKNVGKCLKGFSEHLQDEWEGEFTKMKKKYVKKGMDPKERKKATEKAEKAAGSWTKELARVKRNIEKHCGGQNWALECEVHYKSDSRYGSKCNIYEVEKKSRERKSQKVKVFPADFA